MLQNRSCRGIVALAVVLSGVFAHAAAGPLVIEKDAGNWQIVISREASPSERHGAAALKDLLKQICGADLPIVTDDKAMSAHEIILGDNTHLRRLNVSIDFDALGQEGFTIRTVGDHLVIAGGRQRGTMYGVFTFLEDHVGCRWFVPDADFMDHNIQQEILGKAGRDVVIPGIRYIPSLERIEIDQINDTQTPAFAFRSANPWRNVGWCVRNKFNFNATSFGLPQSVGGSPINNTNGHTFYRLLPPEKYFKDHPEYFSLVNGKRIGKAAQLCLSNPEVLRIVTENLKQWMRDKPLYNNFHVSQNDHGNYCQCSKCLAIDERQGTPMGSILTFVNKVAQAIEEEFPNNHVMTFSYDFAGKADKRYSQKPPKTIRPRKNVIVLLAPLRACYSHPIATCQRNAALKQDLEGWSKLLGPDTGQLYVHIYNNNVIHSFLPQPNFTALQANVQFLRDNQVSGIYGFGKTIVPEQQLRSYLLTKLYWNPDIDVEAVTNEFLEAAYGEAAPFIRQYR